MRWTLSKKISLVIGLLLATALIFLGLMRNGASHIEYVHSEVRNEWTELGHILDLTDVVHNLSQAIEHPERGARGERAILIQKHIDSFFRHLEHLSDFQAEQTSVAQEHQDREWEIIQEARKSMREIEERWLGLAQDGTDSEPRNIRGVLTALESLDQDVRAFVTIATKEVNEAVDDMREAQKRIAGAIPALLGALLFILLAASVGFYFIVMRPIQRLQSAAMRFECHDFSDLPQSRAKDEIGDLTRAFAEMAREIRDSTLDLERQIENRTRELIHGHKLAAAGQLAAGVAHEINNPLAAIGICAEGLLRRLEDGGAGDSLAFQEYLETIRDEVRRARGIIGKLLDFSRPTEKHRDTVHAKVLADEALALAKPASRQRHVTLSPAYEDGAATLVCNPDQIKQVLLNLLLNAIDASDEGQEVQLSFHSRSGHVVFEVTDRGAGIDRQDLDHVFDPFFSRKPQGKGSGLGLAVSYGIVDSHKGDIRADSAGPGQGARFTVRLPKGQPAITGELPRLS